jgi:hypothetical protein
MKWLMDNPWVNLCTASGVGSLVLALCAGVSWGGAVIHALTVLLALIAAVFSIICSWKKLRSDKGLPFATDD